MIQPQLGGGSPTPRPPKSRSQCSRHAAQPSGCPANSWSAGSRTSTPKRNKAAGQKTLFDTWRFHAFFTTVTAEAMNTVTADKTHRGHAIIEQVNADLKHSARAHLPSGISTADAAKASPRCGSSKTTSNGAASSTRCSA